MWSVLYIIDGNLYQLGPFATEKECNAAATKAWKDKEFDTNQHYVWQMTPQHELVNYIQDLVPECKPT